MIASVEAEVVVLAINTSTIHESESATSTEVETTKEPYVTGPVKINHVSQKIADFFRLCSIITYERYIQTQ